MKLKDKAFFQPELYQPKLYAEKSLWFAYKRALSRVWAIRLRNLVGMKILGDDKEKARRLDLLQRCKNTLALITARVCRVRVRIHTHSCNTLQHIIATTNKRHQTYSFLFVVVVLPLLFVCLCVALCVSHSKAPALCHSTVGNTRIFHSFFEGQNEGVVANRLL